MACIKSYTYTTLAVIILLGASSAAYATSVTRAGTGAAVQRPQQRGLLGGRGNDCSRAKPTLFLMSGIGGTQMSGTHDGSSGVCPELDSSTVVWFADKWVVQRNLTCWSYMMSMQYDAAANTWRNSSGTQLWPDEGIPARAKQRLYYAALLKQLLGRHGYVIDKDFFIIPYDWRIGIQGLEKTGSIDRIAQRIANGVQANCGQKAVLITHSFGANIMAYMLHKPELSSWREANVRGWVPVGGPFGGCAATTWLETLSGDFFKLFPIFSNLLPPKLTHKLPVSIISRSVYRFAFGLPSWTFMTPRSFTLGPDHVIVSTPGRNYTVSEQQQLLKEMGDEPGAQLLPNSWNISDATLAHGPVPGVETYCLYSTAVPTPVTLHFNNSIPYKYPSKRPVAITTAPGDGVVDLTSLRLCSRFAPEGHMVEVDGPMVDHTTILSHPLGLQGLSSILNKLGVPNINPIKAFFTGRF